MKKRLAMACIVFMLWCASFARAQQTLVIRGGTLIDGNGGTPLSDATIIVEGERIKEIRAGQGANMPSGARIIEASGKYIIPGLQDFHVHYRDWVPPMYLNFGVTTMHDIGNNPPEWALVQREMLQKKKIVGPRLYGSILNLWGRPRETGASAIGVLPSMIYFSTVEEAKKWAQKAVEVKADYIKIHEGMSGEMMIAVAEIARTNGLAMVGHIPPSMDAFQAAERGHKHFEHSMGIGRAITKNLVGVNRLKDEVEKSVQGRTRNDFESLLAEFDTIDLVKEDRLIKLLIEKNDFVEPNWVASARNITPRRKEWVVEDTVFLNQPQMAFIPRDARFRWLDYSPWDYYSDDLKTRLVRCFENFQKFIAKFVAAGGKITVGTAAPDVAAGLTVHREMQLMVDAGVPPAKALQAATKNIAELSGTLKDLGTIEAGKYADMLVLNADPLADIANTRKIAHVIKGGEIMELKYSADWRNPIPSIVMVDETGHNLQKPIITGIEPTVLTEGDSPAVIQVRGNGFTVGSVAYADSTVVQTRYKSPQLLEATLPQDLAKRVGTYPLHVTNPEPLPPLEDAGKSNKMMFVIKFR